MQALRTRFVVFVLGEEKQPSSKCKEIKEVPGSATLEKRRGGLRNKNIYPGVYSYIN